MTFKWNANDINLIWIMNVEELKNTPSKFHTFFLAVLFKHTNSRSNHTFYIENKSNIYSVVCFRSKLECRSSFLVQFSNSKITTDFSQEIWCEICITFVYANDTLNHDTCMLVVKPPSHRIWYDVATCNILDRAILIMYVLSQLSLVCD